MQTVSPTFSDTLTQAGIKVIRQLSYKRRYWNGSAYAWEGNWTNLTEQQVIGVSPITTQLDTQTENEFQISTATITLQNFANQWSLSNPKSIFAPDSGSVNGYAPNWTKFRIQAGLVYDEDVELNLTSINEQIGVFDGVHLSWNTLHNNVQQVLHVYVDGVEIPTSGPEFYVALNLDDPNNPALIGLNYSPRTGAIITATYTYIDDTNVEMVTVFTGLATEFNFNTTDQQVQVTVAGEQTLFTNTDAQTVSNTASLETIGTGDGSTKIFNTVHNGVGIVSLVTVAGVAKVAGVDYQISNLNVPGSPATITFASAPGAATAIKATYIYWLQNQKLEDLITALANAAGIPSGNQEISPVTFPDQITNTHTFAGQTTWEAGTNTNTVTEDGTGDLSSVLPWTLPNYATGTYTGDASYITNGVPHSNYASLSPTMTGGAAESGGQHSATTPPVIVLTPVTLPACTITSFTLGGWNVSAAAHYAMVIYSDSGGAPNYGAGALYQSSDFVNSQTGPVNVNPNLFVSAGQYWFGLKQTAGTGTISQMLMEINSFGTSAVSQQATTTSSPTFSTMTETPSGTTAGLSVFLGWTPHSSSGTYTSPTHDTGSIYTNTAITVTASATIPSGNSYTIFLDGSPDGSTWNVTYSTNNLNGTWSPTVAQRRYWRIRLSMSATDVATFVQVFVPTVNWGSSSTWVSAVLDMTTTPTSFGTMNIVEALNGGTDTYYTATSSDGVTFDAFVQVNGSLIPQSALKRYIKVKVVQAQNGGQTATPVITSISLVWLSSTIVITLANFTGMTAYDAVTAIAGLCNYEFGFDANENFFFRPKSASTTPVMTLDQSTFVVDVLAHTTGADRVATSVVATYGSYTAEVSDAGGSADSPLETYGFSQLEPSDSSLLISQDANLAQNIAQTLFNFWSVVRKQTKISTTFLPHLELSDIITLTFHNFPPTDGWFWGDTAVYWGMPTIYYYAQNEQFIDQMLCKVVGIRLDTDDWSCEYDLEEVPT